MRLVVVGILACAAQPGRADVGVGDGCSGTFAGCLPGLRSSAAWNVRYDVAPTALYELRPGMVAGSTLPSGEQVVQTSGPIFESRDPTQAHVYTDGFFFSAGAGAQSDYGVSRASARSDRGVTGIDHQAHGSADIAIQTTAAAESGWRDVWTFSGDGHFSGTIAIDGGWSLAGAPAMPDSYEHLVDAYHGASWSYFVDVWDTTHLTLDAYGDPAATSMLSFAHNELASSDVDTRLAVDFDFLAGTSYVVVAGLRVTAFNGDSLDLSHTARLQDIALSNGAALAALSGHDYLVAAVTPVPEPSTWGLLIAGLCVVARVAKRRSPPRR